MGWWSALWSPRHHSAAGSAGWLGTCQYSMDMLKTMVRAVAGRPGLPHRSVSREGQPNPIRPTWEPEEQGRLGAPSTKPIPHLGAGGGEEAAGLANQRPLDPEATGGIKESADLGGGPAIAAARHAWGAPEWAVAAPRILETTGESEAAAAAAPPPPQPHPIPGGEARPREPL